MEMFPMLAAFECVENGMKNGNEKWEMWNGK